MTDFYVVKKDFYFTENFRKFNEAIGVIRFKLSSIKIFLRLLWIRLYKCSEFIIKAWMLFFNNIAP